MKKKKSIIAIGMILYLVSLAVILASLPVVPSGSGMFTLSGFSRVALTGLNAQNPTDRNLPQQQPEGDKLVLGGTYTLESGDTLSGSLFILGGTATLENDSIVQDDVLVLGGSLTANGLIKGDVHTVGGLVTLGASAVVEGDVVTLSGHMNKEEGARVEGEVKTDIAGPFALVLPGNFRLPSWEGVPTLTLPKDFQAPTLNMRFNPIWDGFWWLIRSFIWAGLAVLVALFTPQRTERAGRTAVDNVIVSGGLGCLTILVMPLILVLLALTIFGIPISLIGTFLLWIAWCFGLIVLGAETGKRLMGLFKADWAVPVSAGIGTFALTLVVNGIETVVPCIGWMVPAVVGLIGLGAVILSRFGAHNYPQEESPSGGNINRITENSLPSAGTAVDRSGMSSDPIVIDDSDKTEDRI